MRFLIVFFFFLSAGCLDVSKTLVDSTGENNEVIFVANDLLWEQSVGDLVQQVFGVNVQGVGQQELLFDIIRISPKAFNTLLKSHKNIIIISEGVESFVENNKWASNQFVAQLNWNNKKRETINKLIELRGVILSNEIDFLRRVISKKSQKKTERKISDNFGVSCLIPEEYNIVNNDSVLFWANYDPPKSDEIKNILMFSFQPKTSNLQTEVLYKTDSVLGKTILGKKEGSYVKIETEYPPYYFENTYKGLWKLENGFMGGPFVLKTHFIHNKIVVNIGLVFAPQNSKRKYIKEFEAIL